MGLSNEERITKAFWASNKITNLGHEIDPESDDFGWETRKNVTRLKNLCLDLFPTLSGSAGNSLLWLMGIDTEVGFHKNHPWSIALHDKIRYAKTPEAQVEIDERRVEKGKRNFGEYLHKSDEELFEIEGYLPEHLKKVFYVYSWGQTFLYASNRYDDELSEKYAKANGKITLIINECFNIFNQEEEYAIAYLKAKIFPLVFGSPKYSDHDNWDPLARFIVKNHLLVRLKQYNDPDGFTIDSLKRMFILLSESSEKSLFRNRAEIWIHLIASDLSDEKKKESFKEVISGMGIKWSKKYDRIISKAQEEKKKREGAWRKRSEMEKDWDEEELFRRETSGFHFILNEEE